MKLRCKMLNTNRLNLIREIGEKKKIHSVLNDYNVQ